MGRWGIAWLTIGVLGLMGVGSVSWADTITLKNGKVIEGEVVREDSASVTVMIGSRPEFFAREEVASISRGWHLDASRSPEAVQALPSERTVAVHDAPLKRFVSRLRDFNGCVTYLGRAAADFGRHDSDQAIQQLRRAARLLLPNVENQWHVQSVLVDLVILLLLRAPIVWIAILLLRGQPEFLRCLFIVVLIHGLLLASATVLAGVEHMDLAFVFGIFISMLGLGIVVPLSMRLFNLGMWHTLLAWMLTAVASVAINHAVANAPWF